MIVVVVVIVVVVLSSSATKATLVSPFRLSRNAPSDLTGDKRLSLATDDSAMSTFRSRRLASLEVAPSLEMALFGEESGAVAQPEVGARKEDGVEG